MNEKTLRREMAFSVAEVKAENGESASEVRVSVSSEEPYFRDYMWDKVNNRAISGYEVLGHRDGEIDCSRMKDGLVIQDTHYGDQIGLVAKPEIRDGKLGGVVEFCHGQRAQDIKADVVAGLRRNMSVGYFVSEYKLDGELDGKPVYRAVKWTPYEGSFVNVPADTTVGVGRSLETNGGTPAVVQKGVQIMEAKEVKAGLTADQVVECFKLAKSANVEHSEVNDLIKSGKEFGEIRETLEAKLEAHIKELETKAAKPAPAAPAAAPKLDEGAVKAIKQRYNIANVFRALAGEDVDIGFEREMSKEQARISGKSVQGILVPDCFGVTRDDAVSHGRPDTGTIDGIGGSGHNLVATNLLSGSFIDGLRDALVLRTRANVPVMTGLVGNIAIPKAGDKLTAAWISTEGGNATKTNTTFGQISATPHTMGGYVDITRQLLLQSSIDVQAFIQSELIYALAYCLENAAINGTGTNGAPTGLVKSITSANTVDFDEAPDYEKIISLIAKMRKANTYTPSMKFIGDTDVWAKLATTRDYTAVKNAAGTDIVGGVGGVDRLLNAANDLCVGREFIESHLAPAKKLIYGDFSQMMLCLWSGTDLVVDQYSNVLNGALRTVALQDADVLIRRPEAFAIATNVVA